MKMFNLISITQYNAYHYWETIHEEERTNLTYDLSDVACMLWLACNMCSKRHQFNSFSQKKIFFLLFPLSWSSAMMLHFPDKNKTLQEFKYFMRIHFKEEYFFLNKMLPFAFELRFYLHKSWLAWHPSTAQPGNETSKLIRYVLCMFWWQERQTLLIWM